MNKGLEEFNKLKTWYILKMVEGNESLLRNNEKEMLSIIEKELEALEIIKKHLSITNAVEFNDKKEVKRTIEVFDIDLWNDGKQKEDFEFAKEVLNYGDKN